MLHALCNKERAGSHLSILGCLHRRRQIIVPRPDMCCGSTFSRRMRSMACNFVSPERSPSGSSVGVARCNMPTPNSGTSESSLSLRRRCCCQGSDDASCSAAGSKSTSSDDPSDSLSREYRALLSAAAFSNLAPSVDRWPANDKGSMENSVLQPVSAASSCALTGVASRALRDAASRTLRGAASLRNAAPRMLLGAASRASTAVLLGGASRE
mmetsp:Transcript_26448/g.67603  ORF Transcript_26448/g.67603 Transcript_26448/m.67603 type:complete len:212 (-) Transcript_26448:368-1003(-)